MTLPSQPIDSTSTSSSRLASLLGEMRRMMNGAVVGSMRFYGADYGLNYGVSLPTIRDIARRELSQTAFDRSSNHAFARLLYRQEVRELRLAALWLADFDVVLCEADFWFDGIINSEVAEEAAFALFGRPGVDLERCQALILSMFAVDGCELLHYVAALTAARCGLSFDAVDALWPRVVDLLSGEYGLLPKGVVVLLDSLIRQGVNSEVLESLLSRVPACCASRGYLVEEVAWRLEFRQ